MKIIQVWFCLVFICLAACFENRWNIEDEKHFIQWSNNSVGKYELFEINIFLEGKYENPFNYDEIYVKGIFNFLTRNEVIHVDGFYYQDYVRNLVNGSEQLTPKGKPCWKIRFSPQNVGNYSFFIESTDENGTNRSQTFPLFVHPSNEPGFVRISSDRRYFQLENGNSLMLIGENVCWSNNIGQTAGKGTFEYDDWFGKLSDHGGNYARLWIGPFDSFSLETIHTGLRHYNLENAWRLDYVLELAHHLDMYLLFCLDSFNSLRIDPPYALWDQNPYNKQNGGFLDHPIQFFTNPNAIDYYHNRLRYMAARYGYSTHLLAWEFWNEVDLVDSYSSQVISKWHQNVGTFIHDIDPNTHLRTTSFADSDGDPIIDSLSEMDYVQTHHYDSQDFSKDLSQYCLQKWKKYGKPQVIAETGIGDPTKSVSNDPTGISLHHILWSPLFSLCAGTGMNWWWDSYVDPMNLYGLFDAPASFLKEVGNNWLNYYFEETQVQSSESSVRILSIAGKRTEYALPDYILLWAQNKKYTWYANSKGIPHTNVQTTFQIRMEPSRYTILWYNTTTFEVIEKQTIQTEDETLIIRSPSFSTDVVAIITNQR